MKIGGLCFAPAENKVLAAANKVSQIACLWGQTQWSLNGKNVDGKAGKQGTRDPKLQQLRGPPASGIDWYCFTAQF